jgi:hypothetical protein
LSRLPTYEIVFAWEPSSEHDACSLREHPHMLTEGLSDEL